MRRFFRALRVAIYASAGRPNIVYDDNGFPVLSDGGHSIEVD